MTLAPGAPVTAAAAAAAAGLILPPPVPLVIEEREATEADARIEVVFPQDPDREFLLSRTARYVAKDGAAFEGRLREKEANNPAFRFLFDYGGEEGRFYRWRVYSLLMGDKETKWRAKPFQMTPDGPFWVPPPVPEAYLREEEKREKERQRREQRERERAEARKSRGGGGNRSRSRSRSRGREEKKKEEKYLTGRQAERARDIARGRGACVVVVFLGLDGLEEKRGGGKPPPSPSDQTYTHRGNPAQTRATDSRPTTTTSSWPSSSSLRAAAPRSGRRWASASTTPTPPRR